MISLLAEIDERAERSGRWDMGGLADLEDVDVGGEGGRPG